MPDPVVVAEVLSPSTARLDTGGKLEGYFRLPALVHYLAVKSEPPCIIRHRRGEAGRLGTGIVREGRLRLDPPGLAVEMEALFGG